MFVSIKINHLHTRDPKAPGRALIICQKSPSRFIYSNYNVICTNVNYSLEICNLHSVIIELSTRRKSPSDDSHAILCKSTANTQREEHREFVFVLVLRATTCKVLQTYMYGTAIAWRCSSTCCSALPGEIKDPM